jgi:S1-C subfamily serine protease
MPADRFLRGLTVGFCTLFQVLFPSFLTATPPAWSDTPSSETKLVSQIRKVRPSIVAVGTYYFKDSPKLRYHGTGFAVGDGTLIITNAHTVAQIEEEKRIKQLRVFHREFQSHGWRVSLLKRDDEHDLAVLKLENGMMLPLKLADSGSVQEGETVAFTGYPIGLILGLHATTHAGIISAISPIVLPSPTARTINKQIVEYLRRPYKVFQIDATAYPGNSGSPVFRISSGEVIGIINMVFVKGKKENIIKEPSGITYAIPANFARSLIEEYGY